MNARSFLLQAGEDTAISMFAVLRNELRPEPALGPNQPFSGFSPRRLPRFVDLRPGHPGGQSPSIRYLIEQNSNKGSAQCESPNTNL